jgi:hypothetical protein
LYRQRANVQHTDADGTDRAQRQCLALDSLGALTRRF